MVIKKCLITGANGFVGCHLAKTIYSDGLLDVTIATRLSTNDLPIRHVTVDNLSSATDWSNALFNQDVVIHTSAVVHIMNDRASDSLTEFRSVNTEGTLNLARQAVLAGVKRFIFLSTIKVNGETTSNRNAFTANDIPAPVNSYSVSKAEAEIGLLALGKTTGMEVVIIRAPLVYGDGVKANFKSLMSLVAKGWPLPFRAISQNKRSLVSVYNLVDLIKVCINHQKAVNQVFLVSDDDDMSTAKMLSLMASVQGKTNLSLPVPVWCFTLIGRLLNKKNVMDRLTGSLQLDIEHTKLVLDWSPPYSVEHGFQLSASHTLMMD